MPPEKKSVVPVGDRRSSAFCGLGFDASRRQRRAPGTSSSASSFCGSSRTSLRSTTRFISPRARAAIEPEEASLVTLPRRAFCRSRNARLMARLACNTVCVSNAAYRFARFWSVRVGEQRGHPFLGQLGEGFREPLVLAQSEGHRVIRRKARGLRDRHVRRVEIHEVAATFGAFARTYLCSSRKSPLDRELDAL